MKHYYYYWDDDYYFDKPNKKGTTTTMSNDFQTKVFNRLTVEGHPQRKEALKDLIDRGFFSPNHTILSASTVLEQYIEDNPRKFCKDGIDRLRYAVGLKAKATRNKVRVVLDIETEDDIVLDIETEDDIVSVFGNDESKDGGLAAALADFLTGASVKRGYGKTHVIKSAKWVDYNAAPKERFGVQQLGRFVR